ncbi:MAG: ATP-binding protein [Thermoguttaceae bacterium]
MPNRRFSRRFAVTAALVGILILAAGGGTAAVFTWFANSATARLWESRDVVWATAISLALTFISVILGLAVVSCFARRVIAPVRRLATAVNEFRLGDLDSRVPTDAGELGEFVGGINCLLERLAEYRRSSLEDLLASKSVLEEILNALPDAVIVVAPDGALAAANPPARAVLGGIRAAEARYLQELPLRSEHREAVDMALAGRPSIPQRTDFDRLLAAVVEGQPHRFLLTAVPIRDYLPGQIGAIVVLDDVTDFARLDELRSELIGTASHELKTPLTSLRMNVMLLGENANNLTARQSDLLAAALSGCEELSGTIDELLDVTRIEAGQLRLNLVSADLYAVLDLVMGKLRMRFEDAQVNLCLCRDCPSAVVRGDTARLGIVFGNLLANALRYSPEGSAVTVRISSGQNAGAAGPTTLQVAVTDMGPGIPPEYCERVFEKFFRVEHQLGGGQKPNQGTGIGLYLCREIVRAHGGSICCQSGDDGVGTQIALCLPGSG